MSIAFSQRPDPRKIPQHVLWRLQHGSRTVQAAVRQVPLGTELIVTVDGELLWAEAAG